jgi:hypothetical protein
MKTWIKNNRLAFGLMVAFGVQMLALATGVPQTELCPPAAEAAPE